MKYNVDQLISQLLAGVNSRQREIITSRYGLAVGRPLTLAKIGEKHGVTRERIRQIEALGLGLVRAKLVSGKFADLIADFKTYFRKFGGVRRASLVYDHLKSVIGSAGKNSDQRFFFLLEGTGQFHYHPEDNSHYAFWYVSESDVETAQDFIRKLTGFLQEKKTELVSGGDLSQVLARAIKALGQARPLAENYIAISKKFTTSPYKDFGLTDWPEIYPRTARDWAYLVLKKERRPIHFTELTGAINGLRPGRVANPQTVHNELIKDQRFVLVGRGIYGLLEFNLIPGTAREVITHIINKHGPMGSRNIVQRVLEQRIFKENTLLLNLQNKKFFQRLDDGRYTVRKA